MTSYRFLDGLGDLICERDFADRDAALAWASEGGEGGAEHDIQRAEFLGPEGDWRWAGPLLG